MRFSSSSTKLRMRRSGLSLVELVVAFAVLALMAGPLHLLFSTSARTVFVARDLGAAAALASAYLASLSALPPDAFSAVGPAPDERLPAPFTPAALGIPACPEGVSRGVEIAPSGARREWALARVTVRWTSAASGKTQEYVAASLYPAAPGAR